MATLTFTLEDGQEIIVPLLEVVSLGSENGNDVVVDDVEVSARHAEVLKKEDGSYEVIDLNSASGTMVNGERVQRQIIRNGDKIGFGPLLGVFQVEEEPSEKIEANKAKSTSKNREADSTSEKTEIARAKAEYEKLLVEKKQLQEEAVALQTAGKLEQNRIDELKSAALQEQNKLDQLTAVAKQEQNRIVEIKVTAAKAESTCREQEKCLGDLNARVVESQAKLRSAEADLRGQMELLSKLRADEKNLAHVTFELRDAESKHGRWIEAIHALSDQHDFKDAEVKRLAAAAENTLRDLESMNAHKEEALGHLQSLRQECASFEERLPTLRQQSAVLETRCREAQILAEAREDQVISAEKKLATLDRQRLSLEQRVTELGVATQHLEKVKEDCVNAEARHAALTAEIVAMDQSRQRAEDVATELETRIDSLKKEADGHSKALSEITIEHQRMEELSRLAESQKVAHESDCATANKKLEAVRHELEVTERKHAELLRLCEELAGTERRLEVSKAELKSVETRRGEFDQIIQELEAQRSKQKIILDDLCHEEADAKGRLEGLITREKDLRLVLEELRNREKECRTRFEEIQKLASDAEREHAVQIQEMKFTTEQTRRELADMEIMLAPLRDLKDAMDKRYARLASLPEDSNEARVLWREIEQEKSGLKNLISATSAATRAINLNETVLTQLVNSEEHKSNIQKPGPGKSILHAPPSFTDESAAPGERANVGQTGTGALISGTGQEMALKGRINRLRESVQREAVRLEFLRQERAREESRGKGGSASDSMMREQERQLDNKVRREGERFATVQRKLELAELEEEKRREKIADMERKITELRTDIADAERKRSDARHQADLTQTELKNYEAALDRVKKLVEV